MAWSYRQDLSDENYSENVGPTLIAGKKLPDTPEDTAHAEEMLKKTKPVEGVVTQHQEVPNQNVPRVIEGEGETKKDKERVEAAAEQKKADAATAKADAKAEKTPAKASK